MAGPPVVLLHGFGADRMNFSLNQAEIASAAKTWAVDLPGHGASDADVGDGSVATLASRMIAFVESLGCAAVHLVGHSLGGAIAIQIAADRPDLVASLFLLAPAGLGRGLDPLFLADFPELTDIERMEELLRGLVSRPRIIGRGLAQRVLGELDRPGARQSLRRVADHLGRVESVLRPAVQRVAERAFPKAVIWGEDDQTNPRDDIVLSSFGGESLILRGIRHLPHLEDLPTVNRLMKGFLASQRLVAD